MLVTLDWEATERTVCRSERIKLDLVANGTERVRMMTEIGMSSKVVVDTLCHMAFRHFITHLLSGLLYASHALEWAYTTISLSDLRSMWLTSKSVPTALVFFWLVS